MALKKQLNTVKENWLIILVLAVLFFLPTILNIGNYNMLGTIQGIPNDIGYAVGESMNKMVGSSYPGSYYPILSEDFKPEIEDRVITKSANLNTEIEFGTFEINEQKVREIIKSSGSFLLNENINKYESGWKEYYNAYYQIKIESSKFDAVVSQLKQIGEVKSFNENTEDVTGTYTDLKTELDAEKGRLQRYQEMYNEATKIEDKININDRIYNQERTIKYLEDAINNINKRVEYSSVYFSMNEERSEYADIALVKLSALARQLVDSFNNLLTLVFWAVPYAAALLLIFWVKKLVKRKK